MTQQAQDNYINPKPTFQGQHTPVANPRQQSPITMRKRIGGTTYQVNIYFSSTSRETMHDKILRLVKNEVESA